MLAIPALGDALRAALVSEWKKGSELLSSSGRVDSMATTLKFNGEVHVIPGDKYYGLVRDRKLRDGEEAESDSSPLRRPPAQPDYASKVEASRTLGSGADETAGGKETHSNESDESRSGEKRRRGNDLTRRKKWSRRRRRPMTSCV